MPFDTAKRKLIKAYDYTADSLEESYVNFKEMVGPSLQRTKDLYQKYEPQFEEKLINFLQDRKHLRESTERGSMEKKPCKM